MISFVWLIVIGIIFLCEIILINDLEKPNSIVRKIYNRIEYLCDPQKYVAYALKKNALAWKKIEDIENLQKAISIDLEENEDILKWALENLNLKIMDIDLNIKNAIPGDKLGTNLGLEKAIKILPNKETEGFFIAKLRKI